MGRPTLLDAERIATIVKVIRNGGSRVSAAAAANIGITTLKEWLAKGRAGDEGYAAFAAAVKKADGDAEQAMVRVIRKAARGGTWQAAAWWLERCRSERYALKRDMKVELKRELSEDEARAKYKELTGKEWGT